ncbi:hypothetical protein BSL82_10060 [Tardibacter chloracetimidivorans]|uniref:Uncharacterized protein n=1 Tax=Tardibacter chloracetimidivorans TaxID=1921510 RepID=A0A1L3ZVH1_9SPHN|nr:hypothetical protein BSL82_10060 [Tardibacter chloracetimidivorans]
MIPKMYLMLVLAAQPFAWGAATPAATAQTTTRCSSIGATLDCTTTPPPIDYDGMTDSIIAGARAERANRERAAAADKSQAQTYAEVSTLVRYGECKDAELAAIRGGDLSLADAVRVSCKPAEQGASQPAK